MALPKISRSLALADRLSSDPQSVLHDLAISACGRAGPLQHSGACIGIALQTFLKRPVLSFLKSSRSINVYSL